MGIVEIIDEEWLLDNVEAMMLGFALSADPKQKLAYLNQAKTYIYLSRALNPSLDFDRVDEISSKYGIATEALAYNFVLKIDSETYSKMAQSHHQLQ